MATKYPTGGSSGRMVVPESAPWTIKALDATAWSDFARLVEKHDGVWGGCWCIAFHAHQRGLTAGQRRRDKHRRVVDGEAHAALVYDGADAIGWCQFGSTSELPGIKNRRNYEAGSDVRPDWRITCFFVDKARRGEGVAVAALQGALREIAAAGGGVVEAYPEQVATRKVPGSFLCNGTISMFEGEGFRRTRQIGMHMWVMTREVVNAGQRGLSHPMPTNGSLRRARASRGREGSPSTTRGTPGTRRRERHPHHDETKPVVS